MALKDLTERQRLLLDFIVTFQRENGYSPSLAQMAQHMDVASLNAVRGHLQALEKKGYIDKTPGQPRATAVKGWKRVLNATVGRLQGRHGWGKIFGSVTYHLGWRTKAGQSLLDNPLLAKIVKETIKEVSADHDWQIELIEMDSNKIYLVITVSPDHSPAVVVQHFQLFTGWERFKSEGIGSLAGMWEDGFAVGTTQETYLQAWKEWENA